jgi:hypothetical protein
MFKNYVDDPGDTFDDAASSALLAATVYHLALLTGNRKFIAQAERTLAALFATNGTSATGGSSSSGSGAFAHTPHFTSDGWLSPVVDPTNIRVEGSMSPEGEAFALMLHAAWRDWDAVNGPGSAKTGSAMPAPGSIGAGFMLAVVVARYFGDLFV